MSKQFSHVLQVALGVVNAVPLERRAAMAEERLIHLATAHGFAPAPGTRRDEIWEAAADVLVRVEKLYHEGRLDAMLCGLPASSAGAEPLNLIDRAASRVTVGIGRDNYRAMAAACVEALNAWVRANPGVDVDHQPPTKGPWELALDRPLLGDLDSSIDRRSTPRANGDATSPPPTPVEAGSSAGDGADRTQGFFTIGL
jgi:hypothetical protein